MAIRAFPPLRAAGASPFIVDVVNRSSGQAVDGGERVASSMTDRWKWTVEARDMTPAEHEMMSGFVASLQGRLNTTLVPIRRRPGTGPRRRAGLGAAVQESFEDGSLFDDGTGFAPAEMIAVTRAAAAVGATLLIGWWPEGADPRPGDVIGIGPDRAVTVTDVRSGPLVSSVRIWPPLRAAVAANTPLYLEGGHVLMRSASDTVGHDRFGSMFERTVSFSFVEELAPQTADVGLDGLFESTYILVNATDRLLVNATDRFVSIRVNAP